MSERSLNAVFCAAFIALIASGCPHANAATPPQDEAFTERQNVREERASIRTDHEALEAAREKLKTQCMDAKGQDKSACDAAWDKLRAKRAALQKRVKVLHEKMRAERSADKDTAAKPAASSEPSQGTSAQGTPDGITIPANAPPAPASPMPEGQ